MLITEKLNTPGEHPLVLPGNVGTIAAVLSVPEQIHYDYVAIIGHPHSLQGGTMNNKVVTTMARTFKELGIPALRFNFRGVGQTAGVYNVGIGESEDMLLLAGAWLKEQPQADFIFAGFSFGSYVAYRAAAQTAHSLLITIAPPVHHYNYTEFPVPHPWLIVQGDADEVVPYSLVMDFAKTINPEVDIEEFAETGHFFHGKLLALKTVLLNYIPKKIALS